MNYENNLKESIEMVKKCDAIISINKVKSINIGKLKIKKSYEYSI